MKKAIAVPMSLALCAFVVSPATAGGGDDPIEVEVLIRDKAPAFHGKVLSDEPDCAQQRVISLFREKEGPNKLLGEDTTNNEGRWDILEGDQFTLKSGVYYAKAFRMDLGGGIVCSGDKSEKLFAD